MEPWPLWSFAPYIVVNITQLCMHFPIRSTPDENNSGLVANLVENLITNPAQRHIELIDQEVAMRWQKKKRRQDAFPFCGQDDAGSTLLRPTPIGLQFVYRPYITSFILTRSFSCTWKNGILYLQSWFENVYRWYRGLAFEYLNQSQTKIVTDLLLIRPTGVPFCNAVTQTG